MFRDKKLQFSDLSFEPDLHNPSARRFRVFLIMDRGQILSGITLHRQKGERPAVNIPSSLKIEGPGDRTTLPMDELTKETLRHRILERVEAANATRLRESMIKFF